MKRQGKIIKIRSKSMTKGSVVEEKREKKEQKILLLVVFFFFNFNVS